MTFGRLSAFLYGEKARDRDPVAVVDVGCSGGVGTEWNIFGSSLRAVGFDPLISEIERLCRSEERRNVDYEAAFVGLSADQEKECEMLERSLSQRDKYYPDLPARSSAVRALQILSYDYAKEVYNAGAEKTYTSRRISLDEFAKQSLTNVDILKTDTDGYDLEVLIGAQNLLESTILAARIECFFHLPNSAYANSFSDVDKFMTSKGFYLFDIKPHNYTRGALPGPFVYDLFAQTTNGSPVWADALYFRDLANPHYEEVFGFNATAEKIIKTACVMEACGLADCAAELLANRSDRLSYPVDRLLDLLVPDILGPKISYREYMAQFVADPKVLFPSRLATQTPNLPFVGKAQLELSLEQARSFPNWAATLRPFTEGRLVVTTSGHPWSYAMILPLPEPQQGGLLVVEAETIEGQIGISVANADYSELTAEAILTVEQKTSTVILPVSASSSPGALLVRNGAREAPSRIAIRRVGLVAS